MKTNRIGNLKGLSIILFALFAIIGLNENFFVKANAEEARTVVLHKKKFSSTQ